MELSKRAHKKKICSHKNNFSLFKPEEGTMKTTLDGVNGLTGFIDADILERLTTCDWLLVAYNAERPGLTPGSWNRGIIPAYDKTAAATRRWNVKGSWKREACINILGRTAEGKLVISCMIGQAATQYPNYGYFLLDARQEAELIEMTTPQD
jgi:hypothetical protein